MFGAARWKRVLGERQLAVGEDDFTLLVLDLPLDLGGQRGLDPCASVNFNAPLIRSARLGPFGARQTHEEALVLHRLAGPFEVGIEVFFKGFALLDGAALFPIHRFETGLVAGDFGAVALVGQSIFGLAVPDLSGRFSFVRRLAYEWYAEAHQDGQHGSRDGPRDQRAHLMPRHWKRAVALRYLPRTRRPDRLGPDARLRGWRRELNFRKLRLGRLRQMPLPLVGAQAQCLPFRRRRQEGFQLSDALGLQQAVQMIEHHGLVAFEVGHF